MDHSFHSDWLDSAKPFTVSRSAPLVSCVASFPFQTDQRNTQISDSLTAFSLLSNIIRQRTGFKSRELILSPDRADDSLGEGSTYVVEKRILSCEKDIVAVKSAKATVPKSPLRPSIMDPESLRRLKAVLLEIEVFTHPPLSSHPNIPDLLGFTFEDTSPGLTPMLVMEFAEFGSLSSLFERMSVSEMEKKELCLDVASGIQALHACMITHGDVKQDNVLVFRHAERRFIAKVSDFEHALLESDLPCYLGTRAYNAPEIHRYQLTQKHTHVMDPSNLPLCDAFAYGLLTLEVFSSGRRYYFLQGGSLLRDKILELDASTIAPLAIHIAWCNELIILANDDILETALRLLRLQNDLSPHLFGICTEVFRQTLRSDPNHRLQKGWYGIKNVLGVKNDAVGDGNLPFPLRYSSDQSGDYSILSFISNIMVFGSENLGSQIIAELEHNTRHGIDRQQMAKASLDLCLVFASGRINSNIVMHEALNWLVHAALLGNEAAQLVSNRVFEANNQPKPAAIEQVYPRENLTASSGAFYAEAVRTLYPRRLQSEMYSQLRKQGGLDLHGDFYGWIEETHRKTENHNDYVKFVTDHFLLHFAVCIQDKAATEFLVNVGCPVDSKGPNGLTPLQIACRCACLELVQVLLTAGADATQSDDNDITLLHWVILFSEEEIEPFVTALMKSGTTLDRVTRGGTYICFDDLGLILNGSPLNWSVLCQNHSATTLLLRRGADPLFGDAFKSALQVVSADMLELLLSESNAPSMFSDDEIQALYCCIGAGNPREFQRWCMHGSEYSTAYGNIMGVLSRHGFQLVQAASSRTPLSAAASTCNFYAAEVLIKHGADVNKCDQHGFTPLSEVILAHGTDIADPFKTIKTLEVLLDNGASPEPFEPQVPFENPMIALGYNKTGILHLACRFAASDQIVSFLASRIPHQINKKYGGSTVLLYLPGAHSDLEAVNIAQTLLELGADPDIERPHEELPAEAEESYLTSPANWSCCSCAVASAVPGMNWRLLKLYLDRGVNTAMGASNGHRYTLLHYAVREAVHFKYGVNCENKMASLIDCILGHAHAQRMDLINDVDQRGNCPLFYAILWGLTLVVAVLLKHGVNLNGQSRPVFEAFQNSLRNPPLFVKRDDEFVEGTNVLFLNHWVSACKASSYYRSLNEISSLLRESGFGFADTI